MRIDEFDAETAWWGVESNSYAARQVTPQAWKVSLDDIKARNYNLDIKNPHEGATEAHDPEVLLAEYATMQSDIANLRSQLKDILSEALDRKVGA